MTIPSLLIKLAIFMGGRFFMSGRQAEDYDVLVVVVLEDLLEFGERCDCFDLVGLEGFD